MTIHLWCKLSVAKYVKPLSACGTNNDQNFCGQTRV